MADNRVPRDLQTREKQARVQSWQPVQLLPDPTPQDGITFRWVRVSLMGQSDPMNSSVRFREGWEPCLAKDHPELQMFIDKNSQFKENVEVGGLLLCKQLTEQSEARKQYYESSTQQQMQSVDNNFMRENDPRMPLFSEKRSKVSFGRG